jgi:hypothetical protein
MARAAAVLEVYKIAFDVAVHTIELDVPPSQGEIRVLVVEVRHRVTTVVAFQAARPEIGDVNLDPVSGIVPMAVQASGFVDSEF